MQHFYHSNLKQYSDFSYTFQEVAVELKKEVHLNWDTKSHMCVHQVLLDISLLRERLPGKKNNNNHNQVRKTTTIKAICVCTWSEKGYQVRKATTTTIKTTTTTTQGVLDQSAEREGICITWDWHFQNFHDTIQEDKSQTIRYLKGRLWFRTKTCLNYLYTTHNHFLIAFPFSHANFGLNSNLCIKPLPAGV